MNKIIEDNLPSHIAIVPDGNRRWAKKRGIAEWRGHIAGAKKTEEQVQVAFDLKLKCLSWWGGSYNNLTKRDDVEVSNLFKIYERYFNKLVNDKKVYENEVRVRVIGRWKEILPKTGIKAAERLMKATQNHSKRLLNFFIGYNGTDEMMAAIKSIVKEARTDKNMKVTEKVLKEHLWSGSLPSVDLLIRTGIENDPHNSVGFMMWHTANSQYYFTNTMYPDFGKKEFAKAIREYQKRERRLGI